MSNLDISPSNPIKQYILKNWGRLSKQEIESFESDRDKFFNYVEEQYFQPKSKVEMMILELEKQISSL